MSSAPWMNTFNERFRSSQEYRDLMSRLGVDTSKGVKLNDSQRKAVKAVVEQMLGAKLPKGVEIDTTGNVNEDEGVSKYAKDWKTYAAIGAGATGLGALGIGPLAGVFGAGSAAGAGASGAAATGAGAGSAATAAGAAGGIGSAIKAGLSTADIARDILKASGEGLGAASEAMAGNRAARMEASLAAEQANLARAADRRAATSDAQRKALQASYLGLPLEERGAAPGFAGQYSRSIKPSSLSPEALAAMRAEAEDTLKNRPAPFAFEPKDLNGSGWERAANIGSVASGIASAVPPSLFKKLGKLIFSIALMVVANG